MRTVAWSDRSSRTPAFRRRRVSIALWVLLLSLMTAIAGARSEHLRNGAQLSGTEESEQRGTETDLESPHGMYPGEGEVLAMHEAYPQRITAAEVRDGEWALEMDGQWYSWAEGRLLPVEIRERAREFLPIHFYRYETGPVPAREITVELELALRNRTALQDQGATDTRQRFNEFLDSLYQIRSVRDAELTVVRVRFLGFSTRVHPLLVEPLARVERTIRANLPFDEALAAFVGGLAAVHGYNWRPIAGTIRRSYHSYGVAVDLLPGSYERRFPYWLWAAQAGIDTWWDASSAPRWSVPQTVIDAFEEHGFIWGGKWLYFDNLHFEYRPEIIHMSRWNQHRDTPMTNP